MHTDSSASWTCRLARSASDWTATVLMPISRHARMMRTAISPRLAINIFLNISVLRFDLKQRLAVLHRVAVGDQRFHDTARGRRQHIFADFHRLDRGHRLA